MEETNIPLKDKNTALGNIEIAPEVLEVISGIAVNEVDGVYAMRGTFKSGVNELLGRSSHNKGVHLNIDEHGLSVDVYCYIKYGVSVPKVALEMQQKIKEQILFMSDLEVNIVNVHVVGLVTPREIEKHQAGLAKGLEEQE
ncbi:Asp23/Gls24 family envelope stress response protein [Jeotgalibaca caeni]|uniref:Asp23/Gls24 family envelope stress response protein n=1 Tax=Jeotgalibaca caeni TaxID=3028623 RepID=UPI00237D3747|nr:Asp23/Gls24 family envelope stress response protein [Jeotgalibaca caeni]MDE1547843.1 Asp23/Gls24 family envelope stress response protein [Jeotgalibaca caeni]